MKAALEPAADSVAIIGLAMAFPAVGVTPLAVLIASLFVLGEQPGREQLAVVGSEFGMNHFPGVAVEKVA